MSDFKRELAAPYRGDCLSLEEHARYAQQLPHQVTPNLRDMPAMIEHLEHRSRPYWEGRIRAIDQRQTPLDLRALRAAITRLNMVNRLTWRSPQALRIRAVNFAYRFAIAVVILTQAAIAVFVIYWIIRLIWYLA